MSGDKKIKVLFHIPFLYHRAALDPIHEVMKQSGNYDIAFRCTAEKARKFFFFDRSQINEIHRKWSEEGLRIAEEGERFDVVISGDTIQDVKNYWGALLCFVNHGSGIKDILYRNLKRQPGVKYILFVEGEYRAERLRAREVLGNSEVYVVGYPKLDPIFLGKLNRESILSRFGLDPQKKTVLFAPTYKPSCIDEVGEAICQETEGYNLLIKLHPYSWDGKYASHKHHRIYEKALPRFPHVRLIPPEHHNVTPFLHVADTLLTEASSTMFEFLALKKTGIIYDLDRDRFKHHDGTYLLDEDNREFLKGAFLHIQHPDQIHSAIFHAIQNPPEMQKIAEKWRKQLFHRLDGKASERIVEKIEELLKEGNHEWKG